MMNFIATAIFGLVVGAIAKLVMPGKDPGGLIVTMLIGLAGSLLASFLGGALGLYPPGAGAGFLASFLGAVLLLFAYRKLKSNPI